jgi:hypothetical protein
MMLLRKNLWTLLTVCLVTGTTALASAQVKFERKFKEGSTHSVDITSRIEQKLTIANMETETESDTRTSVKVTIGKRDESGNLRVEEKIESLQINSKVQGTDYVFDSANPDKAGGGALEMLRPVHKALSRRTTITSYGKDNKISQIAFDQDVLNDLSDDLRKLVKGQLDPDALKKAANEELERLPAEPVKKGDSWERITNANLGAGQIMRIATRYTYDGEIEKDGKKLEKIVTKVLSTDFSLEADSPLPLTVKGSDLKPAESKGELLFDRELGQVISSTSSVQIVGDITFVINNMELPSKLDLKIETSMQPRP